MAEYRLAQAVEDGDWGVLDVYSDEGADGAGTPAVSAEYGWLAGWLAGWLGALMRTHWRSGLRERRECGDSLRRWTPLELGCWVPMQSCIR